MSCLQELNMTSDTKVFVIYGPSSWFTQHVGETEGDSLLDIVDERDEAKRHHRHTIEGQQVAPLDEIDERPEVVIAESSDYASLNEHAVTNFVSLIRSIDPESLFLHNPPARIHLQLERAFSAEVLRYEYPTVDRNVLARFRDGFAAHLVGQAAAKETLLAALYPLTSRNRTKPVLLMFMVLPASARRKLLTSSTGFSVAR
jgi:ATP-dependent Clp protease ATP-binding subunit ClpA